MKSINKLIIAGASITNSPWFTWADHAEQYLQPKEVINLSIKGVGNKFIALSVINYLSSNNIEPGTLVMPMFTCVDKLDLYVNSEQAENLKSQRHPPITLEAKYCVSQQSGFWSTGSHFPELKAYYLENYFNLDWMVTDTIFTIFSLVEFCKSKQVELICLFDGDIWNYTESDYNKIVVGQSCQPRNLLNNELSNKFRSMLIPEIEHTTSLFEYARTNNLPIYNDKCKLHPPSDVHLKWFKDTILDKITFETFDLKKSYLNKVNKFAKEWHQNY